jgi:AhpD family alkylhydroperoxidase
MLAVTEVNGCAICSYAHTKKALEIGMRNEEIKKMLAGVIDDVPVHEVAAVMFAQHYTDTRGNPTRESWQSIVEIYGISKAKGILGSVRSIDRECLWYCV